MSKTDDSIEYIKRITTSCPEVGIILGTGLGQFVESIEIEKEIPYEDIPHLVTSTVEHHAGKLIFGKLGGKSVVCMSGRFHIYEGYSMEEVAYPVRLMAALGCRDLYVSNVAGALNNEYKRGDIMIIDDHINLLGTNPLIGPNMKGDRWPDMFEPYSRELQKRACRVAEEQALNIRRNGVYVCMSGPSLETRAEYRMLMNIGADAVGMSTVPEVIVAVHEGMRIFACSIITDLCYPEELKALDIDEIIETAATAEPQLVKLLIGLISSC